MALRKILTDKDEVLHKVCKPVDKFDPRPHVLTAIFSGRDVGTFVPGSAL